MRVTATLLLLLLLSGCASSASSTEAAYLDQLKTATVAEGEPDDELIAFGLDLCDIAAENDETVTWAGDYLAKNASSIAPELARAAAEAADAHLC